MIDFDGIHEKKSSSNILSFQYIDAIAYTKIKII